jgi:hypothetical protein
MTHVTLSDLQGTDPGNVVAVHMNTGTVTVDVYHRWFAVRGRGDTLDEAIDDAVNQHDLAIDGMPHEQPDYDICLFCDTDLAHCGNC